MKTWLNRTIGRQIMSAFYVIFLTLLLTTYGVYLYTKQQVDESREELKMLNEHRTRATDLYESWQSMQYEMRGFVLLGDEEMLKEIEQKKNSINLQTTWFERNARFNARFKEERQYATDARELYTAYTQRVMPSLINYVAAKKDGEVTEPFLKMPTLGKVTKSQPLDPNRKFNIKTKSAADMSSSIVDMETVFTKYRNSLNNQEIAAARAARQTSQFVADSRSGQHCDSLIDHTCFRSTVRSSLDTSAASVEPRKWTTGKR
ncbi:hypothetical protein OVA29_15075 [Exiguobacterium sp. SL14]|nr:hypothetical protein [Exiguobacterium sp. SL14]MCY1691826.1 hypothetical protein [Exiguobacterium sp. SL14]